MMWAHGRMFLEEVLQAVEVVAVDSPAHATEAEVGPALETVQMKARTKTKVEDRWLLLLKSFWLSKRRAKDIEP